MKPTTTLSGKNFPVTPFFLVLISSLVLSFLLLAAEPQPDKTSQKTPPSSSEPKDDFQMSDDLGKLDPSIAQAEELLNKSKEAQKDLQPEDYIRILGQTHTLMQNVEEGLFHLSQGRDLDQKQKEIKKQLDSLTHEAEQNSKNQGGAGDNSSSNNPDSTMKGITGTIHKAATALGQMMDGLTAQQKKSADNLEYLIENAQFQLSNDPKQNPDMKQKMSPEMQKMLEQLMREQMQRQKNKPNASNPAQHPYDVPPSNPDFSDLLKKGGSASERWGSLPSKLREEVLHTDPSRLVPEYRDLFLHYLDSLNEAPAPRSGSR